MVAKKILITQSNYIPWKGYFDAINRCDEFVIYDYVQFTRRDWRNRNQIKTPQGLQWLTIPVEVKGKYHQRIDETVTSDPHWAENHWKTITHNYSRTKYFLAYKEKIEALYVGMRETLLSRINYVFIKAICEILGIHTNISYPSAPVSNDRTQRLVDICQSLGGTDYFTGPAARAYINEKAFEEHSIRLHYLDFDGYPEYCQLYPPFEHHTTILDLLFNEGPNARKFMKSFSE